LGNVTVYFEALSYAGTLTITAITDAERFPDPQTLTNALRDEFALISSSTPDRNILPPPANQPTGEHAAH